MPNSRKIRACTFEGCNATFNRLSRLQAHLNLHFGKRPYVCPYEDCNKSYIKESHLKRHEILHEEYYKCSLDNCNKLFISKSTLKKHADNIHFKKKSKKYMCSLCSEEFNKHNWLQTHMFRHTGVKPYLCPIENCGKRFLFPSRLKKHMSVHNGYTCTKPNCGKTLSKWVLYVKHMKVSHPTIYKCQYCEREFSSSNNLKAHSEVHNLDRTVLLCPEPNCTRFYTMKRNLNDHLKNYHEKRPFKCTNANCFKAFKTEVELNAHLPRHDPNKRLRKKKKKKNQRPSFAARLAGLVEKEKSSKFQIEIEEELQNNSNISECTDQTETLKKSNSISDNMDIGTQSVKSNVGIDNAKECVDEEMQSLLQRAKERHLIHKTPVTLELLSSTA